MKVQFKKLHSDAKIPQYMTSGSAGFDLFALESVLLRPQQTLLIDTGLSVAVESGYELQIRSRSGLAFKNEIVVLNSPRHSGF